MSYLDDFQKQIHHRDFRKFLTLWEEYATGDQADVKEFVKILDAVKESDFTTMFGDFVETALPLWETITDDEGSYAVLKRLIDLQTTNSPILADTAFNALKKKYENDPHFHERIRIVGLRTRENFRGALSNYDLLAHMKKGSFVYHTAGWGTGEVMGISPLRETVTVEFENVTGLKHLTFANAFKTLKPLDPEHFLARRFADPDSFEQEAKKDPEKVLKLLLRDLGPKTAAEIKDEMSELVIPEKEWVKWWQSARNRLKKDTLVQTPSSLQHPFVLLEEEVSHEELLFKAIQQISDAGTLIQKIYVSVRDFPSILKEETAKQELQAKLEGLLRGGQLSEAEELTTVLFLESYFDAEVEGKTAEEKIKGAENLAEVIGSMDILSLKKRALAKAKEAREDWSDIFFAMLFSVQQAQLRDYLFDELNQKETRDELIDKLRDMMVHPSRNPELLFWYFQKIVKDGKKYPFSDKEGQCYVLEALLIMIHQVELAPEYREFIKKVYNFLTGKRYLLIRELIKGTDLAFIKEFLLLVAKCHIFNDTDKKNIRALAQVAHPSLAPEKKEKEESHVIWTTEEGYTRTRDRIKEIGSKEMIENAKEVEAARELGDLRENSEYKFAVEKRQRLQGEMKTLSGMLNRARIITPDDIDMNEVGVGNVVELETSSGEKATFTILGPWDAEAEKNVISFQSQLAKAMEKKKKGESFEFKGETYKVMDISSFLNA